MALGPMGARGARPTLTICITLYIICKDDWVVPRVSMYAISIYIQLICRVNVGK